MGIDEAGRGPVLGAMVYGACYAPITKLKDIQAMGFADSKQLNENERRALFAKIKSCSFMGWMIDSISSQELSAKMLREVPVSLNEISHNAAIGLVEAALSVGVNITELYVDTVGIAEDYQRMLSELFPKIKVTVRSKADSLFPIVSAASICAKVTRDAELEEWIFQEESQDQTVSHHYYGDEDDDMGRPRSKDSARAFSRQFGSGYPGDEVTKAWLERNIHPVFGFPNLVRFSWSTTQKIMDEHCVQVRWGDEGDDEMKKGSGSSGSAGGGRTQSRLGQFFMKTTSPAIAVGGATARAMQINPRDRARFYRRLCMNVATALPFTGKPPKPSLARALSSAPGASTSISQQQGGSSSDRISDIRNRGMSIMGCDDGYSSDGSELLIESIVGDTKE